jgi:hypothetical protein
MKHLLLVASLFLSLNVPAKELARKIFSASYEQAEASGEYIKFLMKSTKLGMFTTDFTGFSKDFTVTGDVGDSSVKNAIVMVEVRSIDTDGDDRNEKMYDKCFSANQFPKIVVKIQDDISFDVDKEYSAIANVRGKDFPVKIKIKSQKTANGVSVSGTSRWSIKGMQIPDPSIAIASVHDEIDLSFNFELK